MKLLRFITDPVIRFSYLNEMGLFRYWSDEKFLKYKYKLVFGHKLNLENPQTFNEKLQWLKLYDRKPIYTTMVDKYAVKKYVADRIGEEYVIPTLGVWDSFDDIDFENLPNQFVLKCTHDSGGLVICRDKDSFDKKEAKRKIRKCLKRNYYWSGREWPYKDVPRKIIAEKYMEDSKTGELRDYKFFCFNGEPKALFIATDRQSDRETCFDFFDIEYNHLPIINGHPNAQTIPQKPENYVEMIKLAKILSADIAHVRIDFYEVNGRVYFGEITFFQNSGFVPIEPKEWDEKLGDWIELPKKRDDKK